MIKRFIPTCVGLIPVKEKNKLVKAVHPHVRGVNGMVIVLVPTANGSSPRAWG